MADELEDKAALAAFDTHLEESLRAAATERFWDDPHFWQALAIEDWMKRGDGRQLARLLRSIEPPPPLAPVTWAVVIEMVSRARRPVGRPRGQPTNRSAAEAFRRVHQILREQKQPEARERALVFVADKYGLDPQTLDNYVNRSTKNREGLQPRRKQADK